MVPLHYGGYQGGTNRYRVLHGWVEAVTVHVDAKEGNSDINKQGLL